MTKLKDGTDVDPKRTYERKQSIQGRVDHTEKMKAAYKRGGADAVRKYILAIETKHAESLKPKTDAIQND